MKVKKCVEMKGNKKGEGWEVWFFFGLKMKVMWMWRCGVMLIEVMNERDVRWGEVEMEELCVLDDWSVGERFWNGDNG
ncbi:hypothetical protein, partial [Bacillus sp. WP8]|uniref:hypothetical protein n=1 Tax=Bacillus sp. WP8 TaxID=756828 RepID=UPI001C930328